MAINWVRGFRRIGWILIVPVCAIAIYLSYEIAQEFYRYDPAKLSADYPEWAPEFITAILSAERTGRDFTEAEAIAFGARTTDGALDLQFQ